MTKDINFFLVRSHMRTW